MCTLLMDTLQALHATRHYHPTWIALSHLNPLHHSNGPIFRSCIYTNLIHCCEITVCPSDRYRSFSCLAYLSEPKTRQLAFVCLLAVSKSAYRCSRSPSSFDMAPTTPQLAFRQSGWKVVAYSSSPSEKQYKGAQSQYIQSRSCQHAAAGLAASLCNSRTFSTGVKPTAALPDQLGTTTAAITPDAATDTSTEPVHPETVRLVTAATILSHSDSGSDTDTAEAYSSIDEDLNTLTDPLAFLDELNSLNADSLSLAIGILRQHQPADMEEADVLLSERLRDLLLLLHQRPITTTSSRGPARSVFPASDSSTSSSAVRMDELDGFWAGQDEWSDVRSALMSIGIDASLDEDDDEEDVWTMEEEGPARRTRLLKSLPRLTPDTAQQLADFLASLQQAGAPASSGAAGGRHSSPEGEDEQTSAAAADEAWSEEEAKWWEQVTQAYHLLWRQARVQQAKQA